MNSTDTAWQLRLRRDDPATTQIHHVDIPEPGEGEALLRSSLASVTANTIAYAELGEDLHYWDFFPVDDSWGTVPMWGFADVIASRSDDIEVGTRVFGFIPSASHFVIQPEVVGEGRFRDVKGARSVLPPSYSNYLTTTNDRSYFPPDREDLQVVFRPLYITSWALADSILEQKFHDARVVVFSSASSKTAYGTALALSSSHDRPTLVGLTSEGNLEYVRKLGCYDQVHSYDKLDKLATDVPTLYVDFAGSIDLRTRMSDRLGGLLVRHVVVGLTHHQGVMTEDSAIDPAPAFWFAPDYLKRRGKELGPGGLHARFSADYREALPTLAGWAQFEYASGPEGLQQTWHKVFSGTASPGSASVVSL